MHMRSLSISVLLLTVGMCAAPVGALAGRFPADSGPSRYTMDNVHSHNDYEHALPFYDAYARHVGSIEADVWAMGGHLYVAHHRSAIKPQRTFKKLYLEPLLSRLRANGGRAYRNGDRLQLLIDEKSSYKKVIPILARLLKPYAYDFNVHKNPNAVRIVLSGSEPPPEKFHEYDRIFFFDGRLSHMYSPRNLRRVALFSVDAGRYVKHWPSSAPLSSGDIRVLQRLVDKVHKMGKAIRFYAVPNSVYDYRLMMKLGVGYINADDLGLVECVVRFHGVCHRRSEVAGGTDAVP